MPIIEVTQEDGSKKNVEVDKATYIQAQNEKLRGDIEKQRELNRHGFSQEDQDAYEQLERQMGD